MNALKLMQANKCYVFRDGQIKLEDAFNLVPGDVI